MGGVLPGAYMMHSFGECPKEESVSRLSQILEGQPHPKYCLSAKACQGILNRAERRGKELPELLRKTLLRQSLSKSDQVNQEGVKESSSNMSEQEPCQPSITNPSCLNPWDVQSKHIQPENGKAEALYSGECRGGGGESYVIQGINGDIAGTLDANYYKGCGERQGTEREVLCIGNGQMANMSMKPIANSLDTMHDQQAVITYGLDRASFNQGKNAQYDFSVEEETAQTLVSRGRGVLAKQ